MVKKISIALPLFIFFNLSFADNPDLEATKIYTPKDPVPTISGVIADPYNITIKGINFSGYANLSYNYLSRSYLFTSGVQDRLFDTNEDGITLQQLYLSFAKQPPTGWGGLVDIMLGRDAVIMQSYGMQNFLMQNEKNFAVDLTQAFLQYAAEKYTLSLGKFYSLVGYEGVISTYNNNFSLSIVSSYTQPGTVTGLRGKYNANSKLNLTAGINNGWDNIRDFDRGPTVEFGFAYTPNSKFFISVYDYIGRERYVPKVDEGQIGTRNLIDIVSTYSINSNLTVGLNWDYFLQTQALLANGTIGQAVMHGVALYANNLINDKWRWSWRGEIYNDQNGYATGLRQNWREFTLSLTYLALKNWLIRVETRHDFSNINAFINKHNQQTYPTMYSYSLETIFTF